VPENGFTQPGQSADDPAWSNPSGREHSMTGGPHLFRRVFGISRAFGYHFL